jgi:hypothetical protein
MQKTEMIEKLYKIYSLPNYKVNKNTIENGFKEYKINELIKLLSETDAGYHTRIHKNTNYIFFGDIDGLKCSIVIFMNNLIKFLKSEYDITIQKSDIKYTENKSKEGSFHYSIPTLNCSCEKLKEIQLNFIKMHESNKNYRYTIDKQVKNSIDTTIYAEHWFRMPNQSKESNKDTLHVIVRGEMIDFIVEFIPENSICIEFFGKKNILSLKKKNSNIKKTDNNDIIIDNGIIDNNDIIINDDIIDNNDIIIDDGIIENNDIPIDNVMKNNNIQEQKNNDTEDEDDEFTKKLKKSKNYKYYKIYKKFFDHCYSQKRSDNYEYWISVGMALKNIYDMDAFELFDYFSKKSHKYIGTLDVYQMYLTFGTNGINYKGVGTLYKFAKDDNIEEYKKILFIEQISFEDSDFAQMIFELAGDRFIYKKDNEIYTLYCYNGAYWEKDPIILLKYISDELYPYYVKLLDDVYLKAKNSSKLRNQIDSLKKWSVENSIAQCYKKYGGRVIDFDAKWWLFGFTNMVYDLSIHNFRKYEKDDYVSITTKYDWVQPSDEKIEKINAIIKSIMPYDDEKKLYEEILSTSLDGRCLEKFVIFNGGGRNGKGVIDDLMLIALGNYGLSGCNSLLFEKSKTGSNPQKANLHMKRFVVFKEPAAENLFQNSVIKELTGGGKFTARQNYENSTEKMLNCTVICECNRKPLFAEEPTNADGSRIIDILFRSTFTENKEELDDETFYFEANKEFKNPNFQEDHKCALLYILMNAYKNYSDNNCVFIIPETIKKRTLEYLEAGCIILQQFLQKYEFTDNKNDVVYVKNFLAEFTETVYYSNLDKKQKRATNLKYFVEYFSTNIVTKKYFKRDHHYTISDRKKHGTNVLYCCKMIDKKNNNTDTDIDDTNINDDSTTYDENGFAN